MALSAIWVSDDPPPAETIRILHDVFDRVEFRRATDDLSATYRHIVFISNRDAIDLPRSLLAENRPDRFVVWIHSDDYIPSERATCELFASGCLEVIAASEVGKQHVLVRLAARTAGVLYRLKPTKRFERMVNHTRDVLTQLDSDGIIRYESPSVQAVLGYAPDEMTGRSFLDFVHEDDFKRLVAVLQQYGSVPGSQVSEEYQFRHADGTWRILESHAESVEVDNQDHAPEIIVSSRDVTHFRQAVAEVQQREAQLSEAQRITHIGSWRWDIDNDRLSWSDEHYRIYGFSQDSPVSVERFMDAIHPSDRESVRSAIATCMDSHEAFSLHHRIVRASGEERIVHVRGEVVLSNDSKPVALFGTSHDETEAEKSKKAARVTENRFKELFKLSPDTVLLVGRDGCVFDANESALVLFDAQDTGLIGAQALDLVAPDYRSADQVFAVGHVQIRTLEGDHRPVHAHVNEIHEEDGLIYIVYLRDELERIRREELLRNLRRHQENILEAERTRISREVHDVLGQELTALKMDVAWTTKHYGEDESRERLQQVEARISSTLETARRIAHGLRPGILDDFGLAAAVEWQAKQFSDRTGLTVRLGAVDSLSVSPELSTAIFRIFQELLTNIARHANAKAIDISLTHPGENLVLSISDDGVGMQKPESGKVESLGLLGIRERIKPWNGRLSIESIRDQGTVVEVIVPIAEDLNEHTHSR